MTKPRVLFVDDEPRILDGLRRSLRGKRHEWDMQFAVGGDAALELIAESAIDVVVSDMRMPGMDGAELLTQVSHRHPEVARAVLSGHTEPQAAIRAAVAGHRFLSKPTEVNGLVSVIEDLTRHSCPINGLQARRIAGAVRSLPTLPEHMAGLTDLLRAADGELPRTVQAVMLDLGLTAKLLQLSNSGFFGPRPRNASVDAVVNAMGVPTIQALVGESQAQWASASPPPASETHIRWAWRHAVATACLVESIASPAHRPYAQAAALLQDIGLLSCIASGANTDGITVDLDRESADGVPFRAVGVELLHLWGLPSPIVTAVAERDIPHDPTPAGLGVTGAVRAAHLLIQQTESRDGGDTHDDELARLLAHPQLAARPADWQEAAENASDKAVRWVQP